MAPPMRWLAIVAAPLVKLLSVSTNLLLALLPSRTAGPEAHAAAVEDEVRSIIASGAESGVFHESQQRIVERVFRLADQTVDTLMVPRTDIDYLNADDSPARVRVAVATSNHSHFPVCRPGAGLDGLLGTVHVKDLVKSGLIADDIRLSDLVRPPLFVPESTPALRVLELFKSSRTTIGFVTDEYGALEGLVTVNDLVEAIVGEVVRSTADIEEPMVVRRPNGSMLVDGMLPVEDLRAVVFEGCPPDAARTLPNEAAGYRTLAGFILTNLGRIPASGDVLDAAGCRFEVVDMDRRRIDKVLMTRLSPPAPAAESTSAKGGTAETSPAQ
jgi:putative hemolysin